MILVSPSRQEAWLAAVGRARSEHVRVWKSAYGYRARSAKGREIYDLMAMRFMENEEVAITCSCPGAGYRGVCKHAARLAMMLDRKGRTVRLD